MNLVWQFYGTGGISIKFPLLPTVINYGTVTLICGHYPKEPDIIMQFQFTVSECLVPYKIADTLTLKKVLTLNHTFLM